MRKKVIIFFTAFIFLLLFPTPLIAAGEFNTAYDVTYRVDEEGKTAVRQEVTITNLTEDYYASEHRLKLGRQEVKNVWARDASGSLTPKVVDNDDGKSVEVTFGAPMAGRGKSYSFTLGYETDAARRRGDFWRVDIPGIAVQEGISSYSLRLYVPKEFSQPAFISPQPVRTGEAPDSLWFGFGREQLSVGGIRAGFGEQQVYSIALNFHLENPLEQKAYLDLPLPPDIPGRQKVVYEELQPMPDEIFVDSDGNYLARYLLLGREVQVVSFAGKVYLYPQNREEIFSSVAGVSDVPRELREAYTQPLQYWDVDASEIQEKAEQLTDDAESVVSNLHSIYEYVVAHLSYDEARLGEDFVRLGATEALEKRKQALCTEYADLFISLARAAGIPARLVEGYAHSESAVETPRIEGALHAWVEVFVPEESSTSHPSRKATGGTPSLDDSLSGGRRPPEARQSEGWIQVDPTWGSTTGGSDYFSELDLSHIAFVRKGKSSTEPYLLANYEQEAGDWMEVGFVEDGEEEQPNLETIVTVQESGPAFLPRQGLVRVRNAGSSTAFNVRLSLDTSESGLVVTGGDILQENENGTVFLGDFPAFSEKEVRFKVSAPKFKKTEEKLSVRLSWENFSGGEQTGTTEKELAFKAFWTYLVSVYVLVPLIFIGLMYTAAQLL